MRCKDFRLTRIETLLLQVDDDDDVEINTFDSAPEENLLVQAIPGIAIKDSKIQFVSQMDFHSSNLFNDRQSGHMYCTAQLFDHHLSIDLLLTCN